jgi:hypothetical protein
MTATEPTNFIAVSDSHILSGFVDPGPGRYLDRRVLADCLRARMAAVQVWVETGERVSQKSLAKHLLKSERWLSIHFKNHLELYALPPPELARRLSSATADVLGWTEIAERTVPVFNALDGNPYGRALFAGLVRLHRAHPDLTDCDAYFDHALQKALSTKRQRHTLAITGLFTDGIIVAFEDWVDDGEPSLRFVAERVANLIQGPVRQAFEALDRVPPRYPGPTQPVEN